MIMSPDISMSRRACFILYAWEYTHTYMLDVCFCTDHRLVDHVPTVVESIVDSSGGRPVTVHVLHIVQDPSQLHYLRTCCARHDCVTLRLHPVTWDMSYTGLKHVTPATMLRLYIPDVLKDVERVVYLDIDVIVRCDLQDVFNMDCGETGLAYKTSLLQKDGCNPFNRPRYKAAHESGNVGVMVMDLVTLRKNKFVSRCLEMCAADHALHDQHVINLYCQGRYARLAPQFNAFLNQDSQRITKEHTRFILHYCGSKKPYHAHHETPQQALWDTYASRLPPRRPCVRMGVFSYWNSYTPSSSTNIGDYIQTVAAIGMYRLWCEAYNHAAYTPGEFVEMVLRNVVPNVYFVVLQRDMLEEHDFQGMRDVITIMNGWWMHPRDARGGIQFHLPPQIKPIFVSFHISNEKLLAPEYIREFKKHQPIGCRDTKTAKKLQQRGVDAYFSGCLTTTLDIGSWNATTAEVCIVDTVHDKKGEHHVWIEHCQLSTRTRQFATHVRKAIRLLHRYCAAQRVVTSRLHCFLPCLAMGVPVTLASPDGDLTKRTWHSKDRFDGLRELSSDPGSLSRMQQRLKDTVRTELERAVEDSTRASGS